MARTLLPPPACRLGSQSRTGRRLQQGVELDDSTLELPPKIELPCKAKAQGARDARGI